MATTNRVYCWKDGNRLFVDLNGATIEAKSMTFDDQVVTLRFQARINVMKGDDMAANRESNRAVCIIVKRPAAA